MIFASTITTKPSSLNKSSEKEDRRRYCPLNPASDSCQTLSMNQFKWFNISVETLACKMYQLTHSFAGKICIFLTTSQTITKTLLYKFVYIDMNVRNGWTEESNKCPAQIRSPRMKS